jgi:hypothetical protein
MTVTAPFRVGGWLPSDQAIVDQWVGDLVAKVEAEGWSSTCTARLPGSRPASPGNGKSGTGPLFSAPSSSTTTI